MIPTGLVLEIPTGYFGLLLTRSSLGKNGIRMAAGANVIDADFRSEVMVCLRNDGEYPNELKKGDRIAQLVIMPYLDCVPVPSLDLTPTLRGTGGFGSTGR